MPLRIGLPCASLQGGFIVGAMTNGFKMLVERLNQRIGLLTGDEFGNGGGQFGNEIIAGDGVIHRRQTGYGLDIGQLRCDLIGQAPTGFAAAKRLLQQHGALGEPLQVLFLRFTDVGETPIGQRQRARFRGITQQSRGLMRRQQLFQNPAGVDIVYAFIVTFLIARRRIAAD